LILMTGSPLRAHCSEEGALHGNIFHPPPAYISPYPPSLSAGGGAWCEGQEERGRALPWKARARKADSTKGAKKKAPPQRPTPPAPRAPVPLMGVPANVATRRSSKARGLAFWRWRRRRRAPVCLWLSVVCGWHERCIYLSGWRLRVWV
jgi:hypothetical protein